MREGTSRPGLMGGGTRDDQGFMMRCVQGKKRCEWGAWASYIMLNMRTIDTYLHSKN